MKILLGSHHFFPSTGGIEVVTNLLAREFLRRGHNVRVVTQTAGSAAVDYPVVRRPSPLQLLREVKWCDVFLQNNISLRTAWPLLLVRRPLFVIQQTWITRGAARLLKHLVLRKARCFAISRAIARELPVPSTIVGNPYDETLFQQRHAQRDGQLAFVGRLVSDKGADLLIEAMRLLSERGLRPGLTIVGDGPEREALVERTKELNLERQSRFLGSQSSAEIAQILSQHQILVVPSRLPEPFGIVALEGIACGCVVIGSAEGGLPEAIGPCGLTFPNGDAGALADRIAELLKAPGKLAAFRSAAGSHLAQFTTVRIAGLYLEEMSAALR
jgi:glycosyltransferase involved in cell wall biosynthesis